MTQFKYPHFLLGTVVAGLWFAGDVYATQSPLTPGPSVGHRPVIKSVVIGNQYLSDSIADASTVLATGETLILRSLEGSSKGIDVDGDVDKIGAYCVWYKVPVNGGSPVVIQDPGSADRNCKYTIQLSDVGFKIKVDVRLFSDVDKALAKGYTINPIESIPYEVISATAVVAPYFDINHPFDSRVFFYAGDGFPTVGFERGTFTLRVNSGRNKNINSYYDWHTTDNAVISVSDKGEVTLLSPSTNEITIEAVAKSTGDKLVYKFQLKHWLHKYTYATWSQNRMNAAENYCKQQGGTLASLGILTNVTKPNVSPTRGKIGTLAGEWGKTSTNDPGNILYGDWILPQGGYNKVAVTGSGYLQYYTASSPDYILNYLCHIKL